MINEPLPPSKRFVPIMALGQIFSRHDFVPPATLFSAYFFFVETRSVDFGLEKPHSKNSLPWCLSGVPFYTKARNGREATNKTIFSYGQFTET
jgi:hypothetical protein